jgi:aminopeptidase 2
MVGKLGYDHGAEDAPDVKELRTLAIGSCASAGDADVLAELKRRFAPFLEKGDDSLIHGDIQRAVFTNSVKHGGKAEWNKIREVYSKPPNPSTKVDAIYSLCVTKDEECLEKAFKMMDDGSCKDQDLYIFFAGLASNRIARKRIGEWFMENFDKVSLVVM